MDPPTQQSGSILQEKEKTIQSGSQEMIPYSPATWTVRQQIP
jgi:hypothetical protein